MKTLLNLLKIAVITILIYKSLFYSFLFLVSGMWIIPVLLLILFAYLCKSLVTEAVSLNQYYKSYKHSDWKEKFAKLNIRTKISKWYSSGTF